MRLDRFFHARAFDALRTRGIPKTMTPPVRLADGIRFGCTRCGNCCRQSGHVWLTTDEMVEITRYLKISLDRFQVDYSVVWDASAQGWRIDADAEVGCPLLQGDDCSVEPVKPAQCRTFPFWPELLDDRDEWRQAKTRCPGIDAPEGRLYPASEIRRIRRKAGTA